MIPVMKWSLLSIGSSLDSLEKRFPLLRIVAGPTILEVGVDDGCRSSLHLERVCTREKLLQHLQHLLLLPEKHIRTHRAGRSVRHWALRWPSRDTIMCRAGLREIAARSFRRRSIVHVNTLPALCSNTMHGIIRSVHSSVDLTQNSSGRTSLSASH